MGERIDVDLVPWGPGDLPLLERLVGDPAMTEHLGGPESPEQLRERQAKYERLADTPDDRMFKIVLASTGEGVGSVGYWEKDWRDGVVYETGWSVLPAFQGRGIAKAATAQAIAMLRSGRQHRYLHAFPSVDNPASNAICRALGFTLLEALDFEYPPGNRLRCNDWRLDLEAGS
ncbi:MAG TPA: GNAT family N-acetyltransferase [Actinomycetota bacterium]